MSEKKQFRGITFNECTFLGRVVGEPQFVGEYVFVNLATYVREMDANGQWTENEIVIPLLVMETSKVDVIRKYVQEGRQLKVDAYYKGWEAEGQAAHAMIVTKIILGDKPYVPKEEAAGGGPSLPPA